MLGRTNKTGNTINSQHVRMKCIPTPCIQYYAKQNEISVLDVYKELCTNKSITFGLTSEGNKFVCRSDKDYAISNDLHEHVNISEMKVIKP